MYIHPPSSSTPFIDAHSKLQSLPHSSPRRNLKEPLDSNSLVRACVRSSASVQQHPKSRTMEGRQRWSAYAAGESHTIQRGATQWIHRHHRRRRWGGGDGALDCLIHSPMDFMHHLLLRLAAVASAVAGRAQFYAPRCGIGHLTSVAPSARIPLFNAARTLPSKWPPQLIDTTESCLSRQTCRFSCLPHGRSRPRTPPRWFHLECVFSSTAAWITHRCCCCCCC